MTEIQALIDEEIRLGGFPGASWAYGTHDRVESGHAGRQTYCPESKPIDEHSVWDLASLSKVIATTTLAMRAWDAGTLDLDRPVVFDLPSFGANGKERITPRNLLRHDAGLVAFRPYHRTHRGADAIHAAIDAEALTYETGTKTVYSDLSMIVLARLLVALEGVGGTTGRSSFSRARGKVPEGGMGAVVSNSERGDQEAAGRTYDPPDEQTRDPFAHLVRKEIARPLVMPHTGYFNHRGPTMLARINPADVVPTEIVEPWRTDLRRATHGNLGTARRFGDAPDFVRAEVHDPTATALGGVAGHAGLFSTASDLTAFAINMLLHNPKVFSRKARELFTVCQEPKSTRALGWDTKSPEGSSAGASFGSRSFGHTGYTGTSLWIDPDAGRFAILLTNRVHPTDANGRILSFRRVFHDAVCRALPRFS